MLLLFVVNSLRFSCKIERNIKVYSGDIDTK